MHNRNPEIFLLIFSFLFVCFQESFQNHLISTNMNSIFNSSSNTIILNDFMSTNNPIPPLYPGSDINNNSSK